MTGYTRKELERAAKKIMEAPHGQATAVAERKAAWLGISRRTLYEQCKRAGIPIAKADRKPRSDRGKSKVPESDVRAVAGMQYASQRETGKRLMSANLAKEILVANGELASPNVSPRTLQRQMRRYNVHPDQISKAGGFRRRRSDYPNQEWQFDVSLCVLFYMRGGRGLNVMPEREFYKNKPRNFERIAKDRVLRYLVTDHASGSFYLRYFEGTGEDAATLYEFFLDAFNKRPDDPFHGLPESILFDKGSANTCHQITHFLDRLDIRWSTHKAGNPQAKGQVEAMHGRVVENGFESRLAFGPRVGSLEELNGHAREWAIAHQGTEILARHGMTRFAAWKTIPPDKLRLCPPRKNCDAVLQQRKPEKRKVGRDLTIQFVPKGFEGGRYDLRVIPGLAAGERVEVYINPFTAPAINVLRRDIQDNVTTYQDIEPIKLNLYGHPVDAAPLGEYKAVPDTPVDMAVKAIERSAYGVDTQEEVERAKAKNAQALAHIDPFADVKAKRAARKNVVDLVPPGTPHQLDPGPVEQPRMDYVKAASRHLFQTGLEYDPRYNLGHWLDRDLKRTIREEFERRFPDGVTLDELEGFAADMRVLIDEMEKEVNHGSARAQG